MYYYTARLNSIDWVSLKFGFVSVKNSETKKILKITVVAWNKMFNSPQDRKTNQDPKQTPTQHFPPPQQSRLVIFELDFYYQLLD